ncbi:MAG TPA: zinc ribbon domain-containing protein, partial [Actinomycetota bacterium]|nr:zinc ribbon domain-containing protein [Actinomycetota bacterium]
MRCPSCGADITDPAAVFCPRCATPLAGDEGATTARIDVGEEPPESPAQDVSETESLEPVAPARQEPSTTRPRVDLSTVRARLEASGWVDIAAVAGLGFLVLLMIGAILVVAAKLNFPALGGGGDALGAFTAVVLAALGVLGIPIVVDGVAIYALPLGALIAAGAGYSWAASSSGKAPATGSLVAAARWGAQLAVPTALLCWFFALVFRFRGDHPVAADAGVALVAGAFWGATFGIIAAATRIEPLRAVIARLVGGVRARSRRTYEGIVCGATMVGGAAVLGTGALLLWIIIALIRGAPAHQFGAGDAFAYLVYLVAFLPNIVVAVVSMSFGAPLEVGARVDLG